MLLAVREWGMGPAPGLLVWAAAAGLRLETHVCRIKATFPWHPYGSCGLGDEQED